MDINGILLVKNKEIILNKLINDFYNNMKSLELTINNLIKLEFDKILKYVLDLYKDNNYVDTNNVVLEVVNANRDSLILKTKELILKREAKIEDFIKTVQLEALEDEYDKMSQVIIEDVIVANNLLALEGLNNLPYMKEEVKDLLSKLINNLIKDKIYSEITNRDLIIKNIFRETYNRYLQMNDNVERFK
ncbi:MAG: hypothetical protein RR359_01480 [Bacilli bacterium]